MVVRMVVAAAVTSPVVDAFHFLDFSPYDHQFALFEGNFIIDLSEVLDCSEGV